MFIKDWKKDFFTIPNMLSLFRLLLIPVYIVIYLNAQESIDYYIAGGILAVSCLTDMIDGQIARRFNMISNVGKFLDPLADKLTQFSLIISISIKSITVDKTMVLPLIVLFVVKELFQLVAAGVALKHGKMLNGALISGKICTTVLFVSLIVLVMFPGLNQYFVSALIILDMVLVLFTFLHYVVAFVGGKKLQTVEQVNKDEGR